MKDDETVKSKTDTAASQLNVPRAALAQVAQKLQEWIDARKQLIDRSAYF